MESVLFWIFAGMSVTGGLMMVGFRNPLSGAFSLVLALVSIAALFAMLHAEFVFILQVLVYAGAIMVLVIFTIMLLNLKKEELQEPPVGRFRWLLIVVLCAASAFVVIRVLGDLEMATAAMPSGFGDIDMVGRAMLSKFVYPFEVISLVLLVAVVGVVILAKKVI